MRKEKAPAQAEAFFMDKIGMDQTLKRKWTMSPSCMM